MAHIFLWEKLAGWQTELKENSTKCILNQTGEQPGILSKNIPNIATWRNQQLFMLHQKDTEDTKYKRTT